MDLESRTAIVTGASSGIGAATARALAAEGCAVALAARRRERLEELDEELDGQTLVVPTDVTDEDDVQALVDETRAALGRPDTLVHCAGVLHPEAVSDSSEAAVSDQLAVNLEGTMRLTRLGIEDVIESSGDVVVISSLNARYPAPGASAYTASKFGVNGFARSLRREVGEEGVRVTVVMPGAVRTEMRQWEDGGRPLDPADVADAVRYALAQPDHVALNRLEVAAADRA